MGGPATGDNDGRSVLPYLCNFAFPVAVARHRSLDLVKRDGVVGSQKVAQQFTDGFLSTPAEQPLGSWIPVGDDVGRISHDERVMRELKQLRLFAQRLGGLSLSPHERGNRK